MSADCGPPCRGRRFVVSEIDMPQQFAVADDALIGG
jgi:hypothetical protein